MEIIQDSEVNTQTSSYHFLGTKTERVVFITLLIAICIGPVLFAQGLPTHADWHIHMERAYNFKRCFWQGQFLPRWIDNQLSGYGLPVFNYYAPLVYYIFIVLDLFIRNILITFKWLYILPVILTAVFGYLYMRRTCSPLATCSVMPFLIFSPPVHMYIYNNNWPGSLFAIPFAFLTLYGIDCFDKNKESNLKSSLLITGGYALMCLSHIATGFIFSLLMIPYFFLSLNIYRTRKFVKTFILSLLLGIGLSAFYLFPAALEKNLVHADEVLSRGPLWDFSKNFLFTFLDRDKSEGYAWAIFDHRYYESSIAIFSIAVFICSLALIFNLDKVKRYFKEPFRINSAITMFMISFFMMTTLSIFVWSMLKPLKTIQFPWRFISVALPFGMLIMAYSVDLIIKSVKEKIGFSGLRFIFYCLSCLLVTLVYLDFINMFRWQWIPAHTLLRSAMCVLWANEEYRPNLNGDPNWKNIDFNRDFSPSVYSSNDLTDIKISKWFSHKRIFQVFSETPHTMRLKTFFFPGWTAYIDEKQSNISSDPRVGSMFIDVPAGKHEVKVIFEDTPIRKNGNYLSIASLLIFLFFFSELCLKRKKKLPLLLSENDITNPQLPQEVSVS